MKVAAMSARTPQSVQAGMHISDWVGLAVRHSGPLNAALSISCTNETPTAVGYRPEPSLIVSTPCGCFPYKCC